MRKKTYRRNIVSLLLYRAIDMCLCFDILYQIYRYPVLSETGVISHPAEAGKWKEDIEFHHAGSVWSGQLYHYEADDKKYIGKVSKLYKDKQV